MKRYRDMSIEEKYLAFQEVAQKYGEFLSEPGRVNLFGIRGLDEAKTAVVDSNKDYDDILVIVMVDAKSKEKKIYEYQASTQPGKTIVKQKNAAYLCYGQHHYGIGYHNKSRTPGTLWSIFTQDYHKGFYQALCHLPSVKVQRTMDTDRDGRGK